MSRDLRNTSLSQQAAQLQRSLQNRDRRRQADRQARYLEKEADGGGDETALPKAAFAQSAVKDQIRSLAAITSQRAEDIQPVFRCELCQVSFLVETLYQQHLQSAVHRKAVEKQEKEAERVRQRQLSGLQDVTEMALGAVAWSATHHGTAGGSRQMAGSSHQQQQQHRHDDPPSGPAAKRPRTGAAPAAGRARSTHDVLSHEDMLKSALQSGDEPLSIDGWVPPSVTMLPNPGVNLQQQQQPSPLTHDEDGTSEDGIAHVDDGIQAEHKSDKQQPQAGTPAAVPAAAGGARDHRSGKDKSGASDDDGEAGGNVLGLGYGSDDSDDVSDESDSGSADNGQGHNIVSFF